MGGSKHARPKKSQNPHQYDLSNQAIFTKGLNTNDDINVAQATVNVSIYLAGVISAEDCVDIAGIYYMVYVMHVENSSNDKSRSAFGNHGYC